AHQCSRGVVYWTHALAGRVQSAERAAPTCRSVVLRRDDLLLPVVRTSGALEGGRMSSSHPAARELPAVPSLEQQKKQARELLDAARAGAPEALARIRAHHPRPSAGEIRLHDAQLVVAREYG